MKSEYLAPVYPVIRFLVSYGYAVSALLGLMPVVAAIWLKALGWNAGILLAGVVLGLVLWLVFRSYVEVLKILAETLMPR